MGNEVSVCIPTYNQAKYLVFAINSVLQQTVQPKEIIVANDCSTDETAVVLKELARNYPLISIINRPLNLGITKNTDDCLRRATGNLIVRLDSDDRLSPHYIERLAALMEAYPNAGYAHCAVQEIDQENHFLKMRKLFRKDEFQQGDDALHKTLKGYRVAANIIMFRQEALQKVNYLQSPINFAEDYHLTASISAAGYGNVYSNEVLAFYRVWTDVSKIRQKRKLVEIRGLRYVFEDVIEPSFIKRGWNISSISNSKEAFAIQHADCLSWDVYSSEEKKKLETELLALSSSQKTKMVIWLYKNRYGNVLKAIKWIFSLPKKIAKNFLK